MPEKYSTVLCEKLEKKGATIFPHNITLNYIKGDGTIVYVFTTWVDLIPNRNYTVKWEWYDPNNNLTHVHSNSFKPSASFWKTYGGLKTDLHFDWPSGLWSVKMYINERFADEKKFLLADNKNELRKLRATHKEIKDEITAQKTSGYDKIHPVDVPYYSKSHLQSWAIVIGISKYKFSGQNALDDLIFADDDAQSFARLLTHLGWAESHIKLLVNEEATQRNIMIALESWLTKASQNDQIVLFWSGHGFPDPENPEKVYFACYDTDISIPATGYRMDKVRMALEERNSRNVVLIADTCHAGKLITRGERGISILPQINKMHDTKTIPKGWIFMVSAETDRKAIEHTSWGNGAFTHCLIKGLSGEADGFESMGPKDGIVTMGELRVYLNIEMPNETQKVLGVAKRPVITTSTGDPDIWNLILQAK